MDLIQGKSFVATLEVVSPGFESPVCCKPSDGYVGGGWLVRAKDKEPPVALRFDYIEEAQGRTHYTVSAASGEYAQAKLGASRNGFLGFYSVAEVTDFWKVEWVGPPGSDRFVWRDHRGYRAGAVTRLDPKGNIRNHDTPQRIRDRTFDYFCVEEGEPMEFKMRILSIDAG